MADCDMTGAELARRVDVFPSTVSAWVNARTDVPGAVLAYLTLLSKVRDTAK
jgi:DNA-binding transcriptional regulator YiaG